MRVRPSLVAYVGASLVFAGLTRAQAPASEEVSPPAESAADAAPVAEAAQPAPEGDDSPVSVAPDRGPFDGRLRTSLIAGLAMPSQMTPSRVSRTKTGSGPVFRLESTFDVLPELDAGLFMSLSAHGIREISDTDQDGNAIVLFAVGVVADYAFSLAPRLELRLGAQLGVNVVSHATASGDRFPGRGFELGARVRTRVHLAGATSIVTELGFLSQPAGRATLPDGDSVSFRIVPTFYVGSGVELAL